MTVHAEVNGSSTPKSWVHGWASVRHGIFALRGVVPLVLLILCWQVFGDPSSPYFPVPEQWWEALVTDAQSGALWAALGLTIGDFLLALVLSVLIGAALGILTGASPRADAAVNPLFQFLRAIPAAAIVPAATLLFGTDNTTSVAVVVFACVWPVIVSTRSAVHTLNPLLLDVSHTLNLRRAARLRKLLFPSLYSAILLGARVTAPIALLITLLVELLTGTTGIGGLLGTAQQQFASATVYGYVVVSCVLAILVNAALRGLERYATRYAPAPVKR
jgi:ABC-type nitrate/sulfonate/bicarbonate transport system permease component